MRQRDSSGCATGHPTSAEREVGAWLRQVNQLINGRERGKRERVSPRLHSESACGTVDPERTGSQGDHRLVASRKWTLRKAALDRRYSVFCPGGAWTS